MKHNGLISYETICRAKMGDAEALQEIIRHYERYISHFSRRCLYDQRGDPHTAVDQEIKDTIISEYMYAIVFRYDHRRLPKDEILERE